MCAGKDQSKPHLHYIPAVRFVADRLMMLTGTQQSDILEIASMIGITAMLDEMIEHLNGHMVDGMIAAKLLSTRAYLEQEYQSARSGYLAKMDAMDQALLKR